MPWLDDDLLDSRDVIVRVTVRFAIPCVCVCVRAVNRVVSVHNTSSFRDRGSVYIS